MLKIRPGVDIQVQEYILARYGTTLSSLSLNACELVYSQHFGEPLEVSITLTAPEFPLRSVGRVSETAVAAVFAHTYVL